MTFNVQSVGLIIVAFINLFLGVLIYLKERKNQSNIFFALVGVCVFLWALSRAFFEIFKIGDFIYFWAGLLYVSAAFIPLFFIFFTYVFPTGKIPFSKEQILGIIFPTFASVAFVLMPGMVISNISLAPDGYKIIIFGVGYFYYFLYIVGYFLWGFANLIKKYRKSEGVEKIQLKYVFWGTFTASFFGVFTNLILPIFSYFKFFWLGPVMTVIMVVFIAYAIVKHKLLNIKVIAAELLVFAVWIVIFIEVFLADNWKERLVNGGILAMVVVFGIMIIRSVWEEVERRERIEKLAKDLETANKKLIEMDETKAEMYSFVSHQIKAPIGIVKGFAQLLYDGSYGKIPKKAKETAVYIKTACDRLINLAETFLNLRRIEEGKMDYQFKDINIAALIKNIVNEFKILADQKGLKLKADVTETPSVIIVKADEIRLRQVIQNLIENAIKYTQKGFINVECQISDVDGQKSILISICDSGMGINLKVLPELFDQFKRAKETRQIQGTGLGLYIAKEIIKAHNGEIWAESDGEGKGSRFYVRLKTI